jgi:cellulose synthase operon protein C
MEKDGSRNLNAQTSSVPLIARLAHQIPKPNDWQALQRGCVLLFRAELNDPNAQEYGRNGQAQGGIDVLGRRNNDPGHFVGIQCRHIAKPIKQAKILEDCREALTLKAELKEIIFATTAKNDTVATDAAIAVEKLLRSEGHDLAVAVYGWESLQTLIAVHEVAYHAFSPSALATTAHQSLVISGAQADSLAMQIAAQVSEQLRQGGLSVSSPEVGDVTATDEDPALHARIDTFRDLFKDHSQPVFARKGLLALIEKETLDAKPWARFRIETNLASIALDLGQEEEAATRFESAYAARPEDPNAIANLAIALMIKRRFPEAMDTAQKALDSEPRADHAVAYLLQAAARSDWQGDPESLIPVTLNGTSHADVGLAEFLRWRNIPGWAERSLLLARQHPDVREFKRVAAIAILSLALGSGTVVSGGCGPVSQAEISTAADILMALAERCLDFERGDHRDLNCYLNNAAVLLRLAGRQLECETLLRRGIVACPKDPQLRRILAMAQASQGHRSEAIKTLEGDEDIENRLLAAEMTSYDDPVAAIDMLDGISNSVAGNHLVSLWCRIMATLALKVGDSSRFAEAVSKLKSLDDLTADLLQVRWDRKAGSDLEEIQERLREIAKSLPSESELFDRFILAQEMRDQGMAEEAAAILEPHVDVKRAGPLTNLYLQCLADARRDAAFIEAIKSAGPEIQGDPEILWTSAAHAWNVGDLPAALTWATQILDRDPHNTQARLLKIEILLRQNRTTELLAELDKPIERLPISRLRDRFRLASLLGNFGYTDRAATFAYHLFLANRDKSQAWMTLSSLVLEVGRGEETRTSSWDSSIIAPNTAVDLEYDDGEKLFIVIEPDPELRRLDNESWEPDHPLVNCLAGLKIGEPYTDPSGRKGRVVQVRHKMVARLHYVLEHHESRFPAIQGFRKIAFDATKPDGLNEMIAELKARHDWFEDEQEQYQNGISPIGVLAHRLGHDTIDTAGGLAGQGLVLKVALGNEPERKMSVSAIRTNGSAGCILDLLSFWTAWRLKALDCIVATCGPIHLTQSVVDRLRHRRERLDYSSHDGGRSARYQDGKIAVTEVAAEVIKEWIDDVDAAIAWVEENAVLTPLVIQDSLPEAIREQLRSGQSDVFDSLALAIQTGRLLISDDLPTREIGRLLSFERSAWLHQVFGCALDRKRIDFDTFIRWTASLVEAGHGYIGVSAHALARSLAMDAEAGTAPGHLFSTLSKVLGGCAAEPRSHLMAVVGCLRDIWTGYPPKKYREAATSIMLRQLIRERTGDYPALLSAVNYYASDIPLLVDYLECWVRGHFLPITLAA